MKAENMEIRAFTFEVRANADEEHGKFLEGTPIVYDSWTDLGWYDEMIDRGALADTDLRDVRFLVNHNTDMIPLARSRNNNEHSTMQMSIDDEIGMKIRVNLDVDNNRHIERISKVFEVSAVTFPAYEATSIQARGLAEALDSAKASLDSVRAEKRRIEAQKQKIRIMSEV